MNHAQLEQAIARLVRDQPLRHAPASLQASVWVRLRAASLPWWHRSFAYWPWAARSVLVLLCLAVATGSPIWTDSRMKMGGVARDIEPLLLLHGSVSWFEHLNQWVQTAFEFMTLLMRHAPVSWWYAVILLLSVSYAILTMFGAAGYRVLYAYEAGT